MLENRVRELRARFKWTPQDLADTIGAARQTIGLIEKGDCARSDFHASTHFKTNCKRRGDCGEKHIRETTVG